MEMTNGTVYESNLARAAAYHLNTCARRPENEEQAAAYDFITSIYTAIIANPVACGLIPVPDTYFEPWEQQKERLKDVKTIRDAIKKVEAIVSELLHLVDDSALEGDCLILSPEAKKPGKVLKSTLSAAGYPIEGTSLSLPKACAKALKELISISRENTIHITDSPIQDKDYLFFSRCVFEPEENWTAEAYDRGMNAQGRLLWLCSELEKRGYKRVDCREGKRISLDYVKLYGTKDEPLKASWADRFHYGIELTYEDLKKEPYFLWMRTAAYKTVLERCKSFPDNVACFIANNTKTCDGCRYCVQTDKTGKRPLAAISIDGKMKCPYYPSFSLNWRELSQELAENILAALDALYSE